MKLLKDSINVNYRIRLGDFYIRNKKLQEAKEQIEMLYRNNPYNLQAGLLGVYYFYLVEDRENFDKCCRLVFRIDPENEFTKNLIDKFQK